MALLSGAGLLWIALHLGVAGTSLRRHVVERIGDGAFRAAFSVLSVASLALLVTAWRRAEVVPLWTVPSWVRGVLAAVMLVASVAFVGSFTVRSPTAVGGETAAGQEPRGILRITRHPMLWSFGLWSVVHVIANGDGAALLFFGSFAVTAFAGMPSIDAKVAERAPADWASFAARTSIVPFAAIVEGRNRIAWGEAMPIAFGGGILLWLGLILVHPKAFGVPAVF